MRSAGDRPPGPVAPGAVRPLGDAALLLFTAGPSSTRRAAEALRAEQWPGVVDVVGGIDSVMLRTDPGRVDLGALAGELRGRRFDVHRPPPPGRVEIPVSFDGEDLSEVGRLSGLGAAGVVEELAATELEVAVLGFSPGFAYLGGLGPALASVARRSAPRPAVPAGSVALAGGYAAVYPQATPGGWHLVGRTALRLFDPGAPPYAVLRPGDRVRFRPGAPPVADPAPARRGPLRPPTGAAAGFAVDDGGLLTTVQDCGRRGVAHIGVPGAGPADRRAHQLANRLVGNRPGSAALEATVSGPTLTRLPGDPAVYVAVVGGAPELRLDGLAVEAGRVVPVAPGQRLEVGRLGSGARTYVAVAGGFMVPEVLGSASTDTLSWLGPPALRAGDRLGIGPTHHGPLGDHLAPQAAVRGPSGSTVVRVVPGPHPEWLAADALARLASGRWQVAATSNRIAVRLDADARPALPLSPVGRALPSCGVVDGALQVPGAGPIALLPDHATLGGYPVVAVALSADLPLLGQCTAGSELRFEPVGQEEAAAAWAAEERAVAGAVVGRYPVLPA